MCLSLDLSNNLVSSNITILVIRFTFIGRVIHKSAVQNFKAFINWNDSLGIDEMLIENDLLWFFDFLIFGFCLGFDNEQSSLLELYDYKTWLT